MSGRSIEAHLDPQERMCCARGAAVELLGTKPLLFEVFVVVGVVERGTMWRILAKSGYLESRMYDYHLV